MAAPKSALVSATISAIGMLLGSPDSSANKMPMGEPITAAAAPMTIASTNTTPPAPSSASSDCAARPHSLGEQGFDFGCDIMNATADCFNRGLFIADLWAVWVRGNDGSGIARRCGSRLLLQIAAHSLAGQVLPL